jgi:hypothetical protein
MEQFIQIDNLVYGKRRTGLLAIAECRVRNPDLIWRIHRDNTMIEGDFGNGCIVKQLPVEIGLSDFLKRIAICGLFQKIAFCAEFQHR